MKILKISLVIITILLLLGAGFFAFNSYIYNQKQRNPSEITPYNGTLSGEYVCLPHKNQNGPQTLECALGMKTNTDEYYALDFNLMSQEQPNLKTGDRFTATGLITPVELLNTNQWNKYSIEGIFSITGPIQKL